MISIKNLTKVFKNKQSEVVALKDVSLNIAEGDIYGIIGLSGAGKSTLVRCINFLEKPDSGSVEFLGQDLSQLKKRELLAVRRDISMIFQNFNLLEQRTVAKNIAYPLELTKKSKEQKEAEKAEDKAKKQEFKEQYKLNKNDKAKQKQLKEEYLQNKRPTKAQLQNKRVEELLNIVGLTEKAKAYPSQLSGGQKQRVAIARALATNPKVLLCDEATSALDNATTETILDLLKEINQKLGVTIVIITHEMSVVQKICNKVAVIDNSAIAEVGSVSDIFKNPQSEISKTLILPKSQAVATDGNKCLRILFDGETLNKPIISSMAIELNVNVNIVFADTKTIEHKTYGQLVIQLPKDKTEISKIKKFLDNQQIAYKEEELNA